MVGRSAATGSSSTGRSRGGRTKQSVTGRSRGGWAVGGIGRRLYRFTVWGAGVRGGGLRILVLLAGPSPGPHDGMCKPTASARRRCRRYDFGCAQVYAPQPLAQKEIVENPCNHPIVGVSRVRPQGCAPAKIAITPAAAGTWTIRRHAPHPGNRSLSPCAVEAEHGPRRGFLV